MNNNRILVFGLMFLLVSASRAYAISAQVHSESFGAFRMQADETIIYDGAKRREETTGTAQGLVFGTRAISTLRIERADLAVSWDVDAKKKRYSETAMESFDEFKKKTSSSSSPESKSAPSKKKESEIALKSIDAHMDGPGAAIDINGFSCRPYLITISMVFESTKDHKEVMTQNQIEKLFTTTGSKAVSDYQKSEMAFYKAMSEKLSGGKDANQLMKELSGGSSVNPAAEKDYWAKYTDAYAKVKGIPIRTIYLYYEDFAGQTGQQAAPAPSTQDESVVQPTDLSGGVSGLLSGIAGRMAAKKIEANKAEAAKRPAWLTDVEPTPSNHFVETANLHEIKTIDETSASGDAFEIPAGYKKVKSF